MKMKKAYFLVVLFLCGLSVENIFAAAIAAEMAAATEGYLANELIKAAWYGDYNMVTILLLEGANMNMANSLGYTALMAAAVKGFADVVKQLLDAGADKTILNKRGETAADMARRYKQPNIAKIIKEHRSGRFTKAAGRRN